MNTILIGYDLNASGQNYDDLIAAIKGLGTWWHGLDSTWIVKSSLSAADVRDLLRSEIDDNDELLVVDITGDAAAWYGFSDKASQWLIENL
jgi:hypothetical protein